MTDQEKKLYQPWKAHGAEPHIIQVPAVTIDDSLKRLNISKVDFVKMDIEGAERYALAGAPLMLKQMRPRMVICIYHRPDDPKVVQSAVLNARPDYSIDATKKQAYFY